MTVDRATKSLVVIWTVAALWGEIWLTTGWTASKPVAAAVFLIAAAITALDRRLVGLVLVGAYVYPAAIWIVHGSYHAYFSSLWTVALVGALLPASLRTGWHIPSLWRLPLVSWAVVVGIGAAVATLREIDFTPELIRVTGVANTVGGGWPAFWITSVLHATVTIMAGVLLFDWLLSLPREHFYAGVAWPLAAGVVPLLAAAIYQMLVDMAFLNPTPFLSLGRASGTMLDANLSGTIAALWIAGGVLWSGHAGRFRPYVTAAWMAACWLAVWATGSRTAFAAAAIVTVFAIRTRLSSPLPKISLARGLIAGVALTTVAFALVAAQPRTAGPLARLIASAPESVDSVPGFLAEQLWKRNGYGTAATAMIEEYPLFGVGVGSFGLMLSEFPVTGIGPLVPDNAQNWYRQQFAELGLVGSLGWIAWVIGFGTFVMRQREREPPEAWTARGALIAFAAISFVGVPGQEIAVVVTFWVLAAWYVKLVGAPSPLRARSAVSGIAALAVIVYAAGTLYAATTQLRVPIRATRVGWPYQYGLYSVDADDFRWTQQRAVAVLPVRARWLALTVSLDYRALTSKDAEVAARQPAVATRPVIARLRVDGNLVFERELATTAPATTLVPLSGDQKWVLVETWVSDVLRPQDFGVSDLRELGMRVQWRFHEAPPGAQGSGQP